MGRSRTLNFRLKTNTLFRVLRVKKTLNASKMSSQTICTNISVRALRVKNWLSKEGYRIDNLIDNAAIFVCDENGNVNMEILFADMLSVFKNMEEVPFEHGLLKGTIGKGVIRIALPDNPLVAFLFGETGALKVTDTDLLELKALFTEG